jgi:hypothetical protein
VKIEKITEPSRISSEGGACDVGRLEKKKRTPLSRIWSKGGVQSRWWWSLYKKKQLVQENGIKNNSPAAHWQEMLWAFFRLIRILLL